MRINAYLFGRSTDALEPLRELGQLSAGLSLLMLDRTAAREPAFAEQAPHRADDVAVPLTPELAQLTRGLHPLSPLGGPASGLVGAGQHLGRLHGLGLGAYRDLSATLSACALGADVSRVAQVIRDGGLLVMGDVGELAGVLARHAQSLALEVPDDAPEAPPAVLAPQAPSVEPGAYVPALAPAGDETDPREQR